VLQWPGVPILTGGFGASLGISTGGVNVNASATLGFGGITAGISGGIVGGVGGGITGRLGGGVSAALSGGVGGISANVSANLSAGISGSLTGAIGPLSGAIGLSPFGVSLSASLGGLVTVDITGGLFLGPRWGVFDENGLPVAPWESVIKIDYRHDNRIANFPTEEGEFRSYNKVQVPWDARISFVVGSSGGAARRTQLLASLEAAVRSLALYTVVTPEAIYYRANLTHMEYARESRRGVNLMTVDVWIQEVRQTAESTFTNTPKEPTSEPATNNGETQGQDAPTGTLPAKSTAPTASSDSATRPPTPQPTKAPDPTPATPPAMPTDSAPPSPVSVPPTALAPMTIF
jgi:hypothetical protein